MKKPAKREGRLVELAVESVRNSILDLTLEPGGHINDKRLMRTFELTRTPMREALNRLAAEGLVDIIPNRGAYVHRLDLSEIEQLFDAYRVSERVAAFHCNFDDPTLVSDVENMLRQHRAAVQERRFLDVTYWFAASRTRIAESCGNKYIVRFCERMNSQMRRLSFYVYRIEARDPTFRENQLARAMHLHSEVLESLSHRDRNELMDVLNRQVTIFRDRVGRALSQHRWPELPLADLRSADRDPVGSTASPAIPPAAIENPAENRRRSR